MKEKKKDRREDAEKLAQIIGPVDYATLPTPTAVSIPSIELEWQDDITGEKKTQTIQPTVRNIRLADSTIVPTAALVKRAKGELVTEPLLQAITPEQAKERLVALAKMKYHF